MAGSHRLQVTHGALGCGKALSKVGSETVLVGEDHMACVMVEKDPSGQTEAGQRGTGEGGRWEGKIPCGDDHEGISV